MNFSVLSFYFHYADLIHIIALFSLIATSIGMDNYVCRVVVVGYRESALLSFHEEALSLYSVCYLIMLQN